MIIKGNPWFNTSFNKLTVDVECDKLNKKFVTEILNFAEEKLVSIFPADDYKKKIEIVLLLFLNKNTKETENEKRALVKELIANTQIEHQQDKYKSGRFSFLITNLIHFFCYIFVKIILSPAVVLTFEGCTRSQVESFFTLGESIGKLEQSSFESYFNEKLKKLNPKLTPDAVIHLCLPYVLDPIKKIIQQNSEMPEVEISDKDIEQIINHLVFLYNPFNISDVFLTLKLKNY